MYKEELMDHFRYPRNKKKLEKPDFTKEEKNVSCGDQVCVQGKIETDASGVQRIADLGFSGSGCVISLAAASMLTEKCIGKTVDEVLAVTKDDMVKMLGLQLGPVRLRCALLCLQALQNGLQEFRQEKSGEEK